MRVQREWTYTVSTGDEHRVYTVVTKYTKCHFVLEAECSRRSVDGDRAHGRVVCLRLRWQSAAM